MREFTVQVRGIVKVYLGNVYSLASLLFGTFLLNSFHRTLAAQGISSGSG